MPFSEQLTSVINFAIATFLLTGVAVVAGRAIGHHSIPWEDKVRLTEKYGKWAVNQAEAFCPENDVACVEREARRLFESRLKREKERFVE
jgi:hypothetical protein